MRINQYGEHTESLIVLNEAHAAHVCREIVNLVCAVGRCFAVLLDVQIQRKVLNFPEALIPVIQRLDVHRPNSVAALFAKLGNQTPPRNPPAPVTTTRSDLTAVSLFPDFVTETLRIIFFNGYALNRDPVPTIIALGIFLAGAAVGALLVLTVFSDQLHKIREIQATSSEEVNAPATSPTNGRDVA